MDTHTGNSKWAFRKKGQSCLRFRGESRHACFSLEPLAHDETAQAPARTSPHRKAMNGTHERLVVRPQKHQVRRNRDRHPFLFSVAVDATAVHCAPPCPGTAVHVRDPHSSYTPPTFAYPSTGPATPPRNARFIRTPQNRTRAVPVVHRARERRAISERVHQDSPATVKSGVHPVLYGFR
jgi:hypothetical protein